MRAEQFEFVIENPDERGAMPTLRWGRHTVACCEWPGTLLAMLRADVLGPKARAEAEGLLSSIKSESETRSVVEITER